MRNSRVRVSCAEFDCSICTQVQIENESSWYQARKELGGGLHLRRDVEEVIGEIKCPASNRSAFQGFYYTMLSNKAGDLVPTRVPAGTASMPLKAWRLADNACMARDAQLTKASCAGEHSQEDLVCTFLQATVVSPLFAGLMQMERLYLVIGAFMGATKMQAYKNKAKVNTALATLGNSRLELKLMTPVQWRSLGSVTGAIQRCGDSFGQHSASLAQSEAAIRVKEAGSSIALTRLLREASSEKYKSHQNSNSVRRSNPFGHFLYTLPPRYQEFLLAKQRNADSNLEQVQRKAMRRQASFELSHSPSHKTRAEPGKVILPTSILLGTLRDPAKEERKHNALLASWFSVDRKCKEQLAVRIQHIFRKTLLTRALYQNNQRKLAITYIQSRIRGQIGRAYTTLFAKVASLSATSIATRHRMVIATRCKVHRGMLMRDAASKIQSYTRRHHAYCYVNWLQQNWKNAAKLEFGARQILILCQFKLWLFRRIRVEPMSVFQEDPLLFALAPARIAARLRGNLGRTNFVRKLSANVVHRVVNPARSLLQRFMRGCIGRYLALNTAQKNKSATRIQQVIRGHTKVVWRKRTCYLTLKSNSVIQLQKVARGHLDRIFVQLKNNETNRIRLYMILLPRLQAYVRGIKARQIAMRLRILIVCSNRVQRAWCQYSLRIEARHAYNKKLLRIHTHASTQITSRLRGLFARKRCSSMRHATAGHRFKSARTILRSWLRYRSVSRFAVLKEEWQVENSTRTLMAWHSLRDDVHQDMEDVRADIKSTRRARSWARKRVRDLRSFIAEAELRLPKVQSQIIALDTVDIDKGWDEALKNEWERLTSQLAMAVEEKRLVKIQASRCDTQLLDLQLEYEDIELDIDDVAMREQAEFEFLRRLEIQHAEVRAESSWIARVRHERMRWRVRNVRMHVLKRERKTMADLFVMALQRRELALSSTLSAYKQHRLFTSALHEASRKDRAMRSKLLNEVTIDEASAVSKLRTTYDAVLSGIVPILEGGGLEMRRSY